MRAFLLVALLACAGCEYTRNAPLIEVQTTDNVNVTVDDVANGNETTGKLY